MESKDSDYDVKVRVFIENQKNIPLINPKSEVITASFNEKLERCSPEGCLIDIQGFDIIKFSKMLSSSNPTVIEMAKFRYSLLWRKTRRVCKVF